MAGPDRALSALKLFTLEQPVWTVEQAAAALGVSASSAYRYVAALAEAGLLTAAASGRYTLGPAIIQYDRQIQIADPLLRAVRPIMTDLQRSAPRGSAVLVCRIFRETVLCVHQIAEPDRPTQVSYERGRPMPLFRGATSKVILANLAFRDLRRVYEANRSEVAAAGVGETWEAFRSAMAAMRKAGYAVTREEVDPGYMGVAAAIFGDAGRVLGSLSYVIPIAEDRAAPGLATLVAAAARRVDAAMRTMLDDPVSTRSPTRA
jgi:DNA-binding IclR family transcriptional regulator